VVVGVEVGLRKVERALALFDRNVQSGAQGLNVAIVRHFEVVDASHDRREELVGSVRCFCGLADDGEHGCERLETCENEWLAYAAN
jgi:hypothetical protein